MSELVAEKKQAYHTLVALLHRRDKVYEETGEDPLHSVGDVIKAAGLVRSELDPEEYSIGDVPSPSEVFDNE